MIMQNKWLTLIKYVNKIKFDDVRIFTEYYSVTCIKKGSSQISQFCSGINRLD